MAKMKKIKHGKYPSFKGHYYKICDTYEANEKFSGKGYNAHICKSCTSKSSAEKAEVNWLKKRMIETSESEDDKDGENRELTWTVNVKYKNGIVQETNVYEALPDEVIEIFNEFDEYFKEEEFEE